MPPFPSSRLLLLLGTLCLGLAACSSSTEETGAARPRRKASRSLSSQFEWAVQSYEAGHYQEAVERFERLKGSGAEVPEFDLILFYLGMSHFRLGELTRSVEELEGFLRSGSPRTQSQEARITLLLAFEKLERWKESAALSAETDKLTLFHHNRTLLKLLWARALIERGEVTGAKAVLEDSAAFLDKITEEEDAPVHARPDRDLWGRYHFTQVLLEARECALTQPKELAQKGTAKKRLYVPWMESVTDCLRAALTHASKELFAKESLWGEKAEPTLSAAVEDFGQRIQRYLKQEAGMIERHRSLHKSARESLYRLLGTLDQHLISLRSRGASTHALDKLRKQIDRLLVSVSGPT